MMTDEPSEAARVAFPQERRRYVRVRKEITVTYSIIPSGAPEAGASTRDMSVGGLQFATGESLDPGTDLLLALSLDETGVELTVRAQALEVSYCLKGRASAEWRPVRTRDLSLGGFALVADAPPCKMAIF
jgi:c-di-GMP-binding flagellar brake protein YcgR